MTNMAAAASHEGGAEMKILTASKEGKYISEIVNICWLGLTLHERCISSLK